MSIDLSSCTEAELWHHVAAHLESQGIGICLVGGAVVSIYTDGAYRSGDLDFVEEQMFGSPIVGAMEELGFQRDGRHFVHATCPHLFVEFVSGPLGIGADEHIVPRVEKHGGHSLKILSPTDCVKDRLASYIHFRARECLEQAVLVARAQTVDREAIETWCQGEGPRGPEAFSEWQRLTEESSRFP